MHEHAWGVVPDRCRKYLQAYQCACGQWAVRDFEKGGRLELRQGPPQLSEYCYANYVRKVAEADIEHVERD